MTLKAAGYQQQAYIPSVPVSFATLQEGISWIIVNYPRQDESNMWEIKRKETTVEGSAEAEINLMINTQIAQQQPGKECCSEIL